MAAEYSSRSRPSTWESTNRLLPLELQSTAESIREQWLDVGQFRVHLDEHGPADAEAVLVVFHGGGGNGRLMAPIGTMAARHGFATIAPDLPGFGLTLVSRKRRLVYDDWRRVAAAVVEHAAARFQRVVVMGLSMGGLVAYDAAAQTRRADAVVVTCLLEPTNPAVRRQLVRWPWMATPTGALVRLPLLMDTFPIKMKWVSKMNAIANDPALVRSIVRDPLSGGNWMPGRWLRTFLTSKPVMEPEAFDVCPVVMAHPADDRWTNVSASLLFFERLHATHRRLVMLDNAGHFPVEQPGRQQLESVVEELLRGASGLS